MQALSIVAALLNAASPVSALVGTRIHVLQLPQNTAFPAIALDYMLDEPMELISTGTQLRRCDVTAHALAKSQASLQVLQYAIEAACAFQRGTFAGFSTQSVSASSIGKIEFDSTQVVWYMPITFTVIYRR